MPNNKNKKECYAGLIVKLDKIEDHINKVYKGISQLRLKFSQELDPEEEVCPDEIASATALVESIDDICLSSLLEREPEGEA